MTNFNTFCLLCILMCVLTQKASNLKEAVSGWFVISIAFRNDQYWSISSAHSLLTRLKRKRSFQFKSGRILYLRSYRRFEMSFSVTALNSVSKLCTWKSSHVIQKIMRTIMSWIFNASLMIIIFIVSAIIFLILPQLCWQISFMEIGNCCCRSYVPGTSCTLSHCFCWGYSFGRGFSWSFRRDLCRRFCWCDLGSFSYRGCFRRSRGHGFLWRGSGGFINWLCGLTVNSIADEEK